MVLTLSVGLAFAAWGALLGEDNKLAYVFGIASLIVFIFVIFIWVGTLGEAIPYVIKPLP